MFKIGHAHGGLGKVKVENDAGFEVSKKQIENILVFYLKIFFRI